MARPPSHLFLGPVSVEVLTGADADAKIRDLDDADERAMAGIDVAQGWVAVDPKATPEAAAVLLAHEAVHGMLFQAGHPLNDKQEEALAQALAPRLVALVRDNPALVAYWRRPSR